MNMIKACVFTWAILHVHVLVVHGEQDVTCMSCQDVKDPRDCRFSAICGKNEICFTREYTDHKGLRSFRLGCESSSRCSLSLNTNIVGRRDTQKECYSCCSSDECNTALCPGNGGGTHANTELHILVVSRNSEQLYHLIPSTGYITTVATGQLGTNTPVAIDYDPVNKDVYWTDVGLDQIRVTGIQGTNDRLLKALNGAAVPDGIAVDSSRRKVFYSDAGNDVIVVMDMDGKNSKIIINSTDLDQPRAVVLDEGKRKIYWTDWGSSPYIASANYDGSSMLKIVVTGLAWPNGLAIDKDNGVLYWCDGRTHKIESVNVDGTGRKQLMANETFYCFDIFYYQGMLYFDDWQKRSIFKMPSVGGTPEAIFNSTSFSGMGGIHVFSTERRK